MTANKLDLKIYFFCLSYPINIILKTTQLLHTNDKFSSNFTSKTKTLKFFDTLNNEVYKSPGHLFFAKLIVLGINFDKNLVFISEMIRAIMSDFRLN